MTKQKLEDAVDQLVVTNTELTQAFDHQVIYADEHGVTDSSSIDSSAALQVLLDTYPTATIILPKNVALSTSIKYPSNCDIRGRNGDACAIWMKNGFVGTAAFEPVSTVRGAVLRPRITNLICVDLSAVADNKGSTSVLNGIDVTGTFRAEVTNVKGSKINNVVNAEPGPIGVSQNTRRTKMVAIDGSNVNRLFWFKPAADNRLAHGDIQCEAIYSTGSVKYGAAAEDTDGFTWCGSTVFPDAQLKLSGHYLTIAVALPFEAKAKLTESTATGECLLIAPRAGGAESREVIISCLSAGFAGRLADTTSGNPPQVNKSACAIRMVNVKGFNISVTTNDPSEGALMLDRCSNGLFNLSSRSANTQDTGSGVIAAGTYDAVLMQNCTNVLGRVADTSVGKRYAVYMDDGCAGCHIDVVTDRGQTSLPSQVRIPANGNNVYRSLSKQADGSYKLYASSEAEKLVVSEATGSVTPNVIKGRNGVIIRFENTVTTNVTDIPDILDYQEATIHIQDNGATKLVSKANGGKFVWADGSTATKFGRGTIVRVMRAPTTGDLVQL